MGGEGAGCELEGVEGEAVLRDKGEGEAEELGGGGGHGRGGARTRRRGLRPSGSAAKGKKWFKGVKTLLRGPESALSGMSRAAFCRPLLKARARRFVLLHRSSANTSRFSPLATLGLIYSMPAERLRVAVIGTGCAPSCAWRILPWTTPS